MALVPDVVRRLRAAEHEVIVESGAGDTAGAPDAAFVDMGATIGDPWEAEVVAKVAPPTAEEVGKLRASTILVGFLNPLGNPEGLQAIAATGATALAMEIPAPAAGVLREILLHSNEDAIPGAILGRIAPAIEIGDV